MGGFINALYGRWGYLISFAPFNNRFAMHGNSIQIHKVIMKSSFVSYGTDNTIVIERGGNT